MAKIFMHFISLQIQKFALRFPHLSDAESFLNCVKVQFPISVIQQCVPLHSYVV